MRLIDADALEKSLEKLWNVHDDQDFANKDVWREIENAPTIKPERKKGKWIEYPDCLRYEGAYNDDHIVCSECGHVFSICDNCTEEFDFCPHCGSYNGEQEK